MVELLPTVRRRTFKKFIFYYYFIILPTDNSTIANARFSFSLALAGDGNNVMMLNLYLHLGSIGTFSLHTIILLC